MASLILGIDDDPFPPELAPELERRGHQFVQVADPEEALRLVAGGGPVLVFLELMLQGGDGFDLLESIASLQPDLPVVVATRSQDSSLYPRAVEIGCRDYFTKPVLASQLLACVYELAGQPMERAVDTREGAESDSVAEPELAGGTEGLGFAELLHELHQAGFSGAVIASAAGRRTGVELRNGAPVAASSNAGRERIEDFLLRRGRLTAEQHDSLIEQIAGGLGRAEELLVEGEIISDRDLREARAEQGLEILLEVFDWPEVRQRLLPGKRLKADTALPVDANAPALILRGVLRGAQAHVDAWLARSRDLYASEGALLQDDPGSLSREQRDLATALQGDRSLAEIVAQGVAEPRLLCALALSGALDLHADPILELDEALSPLAPQRDAEPEPEAQPEVEPEAPASSVAADAQPDAAPPADRRERRSRKKRKEAKERKRREPKPQRPGVLTERVRSAEAVARERELERRLAELRTLSELLEGRDDFQVLEVGEDCSDDEVQSAYQAKLALDPLRVPPELSEEPELVELVKEVRGRLADAYQHLRTQDGRRVREALRQTPRAEPEAADRALDAEGWFRKGEAALQDHAYEKAVEALGMAVHLDPEQGEYLAHLGYALFLSNPTDAWVRREAMDQIAKGIKASPGSPLSYVFLGRALKANDDLVNARRMFRRALKIDRDFHPAVQELRLLTARREKEKKTGLLGRLRRS